MRAQGKTFRAVLRAVEHASANEGVAVLYVCTPRPHLDYALNLAVDILDRGARGFFKVYRHNRMVALENNSRIFFVDTHYIMSSTWLGLNVTKVEEDLIEIIPPGYDSHMSMLETKIEASRAK